jgi:GNAT superfamily N-acetyltransferase
VRFVRILSTYDMMSYRASMAVEATGSPPMTIVVRTMESRDLCFAAALHEQSLRHGLFPALGRRFLVRYLGTYLNGDASVALVAELAGSPAGFLVGVLDESTHYRHVLHRHGTPLAASGLVALMARPTVAWRFVRTRVWRYVLGVGRLARGGRRGSGGAATAVLSHVAVHPELRGSGVGSDLVATFAAAAQGSSAAAIRLTTRAGADGAGDFYLRLGWRPVGSFVDADGVSWDRLRFDLH